MRRNQDPPAIGDGLPLSPPIGKCMLIVSDYGDKYVELWRREGSVPPPAQSE